MSDMRRREFITLLGAPFSRRHTLYSRSLTACGADPNRLRPVDARYHLHTVYRKDLGKRPRLGSKSRLLLSIALRSLARVSAEATKRPRGNRRASISSKYI
jgi:hypothetical protein